MPPVVEPRNGHEIERLITALLNATGVVYRVIDSTEHPPDADGAEIMGIVAERLRGTLALLAEHTDDDELAVVTRVLAEATLLAAHELGLEGYFRVG